MEKTTVAVLVIILSFGVLLFGATAWVRLSNEQQIRHQTTTAIVFVSPQNNVPVETTTGPVAVNTDQRPVAAITDPRSFAAITDPSSSKSEVRTEQIKELISKNGNQKRKTPKGQVTDTMENGLKAIGDNHQMTPEKTTEKKRKQRNIYVRYSNESSGEVDMIGDTHIDDKQRSPDTSGGYHPSLDKEAAIEKLVVEQGGMFNISSGRPQLERHQHDSYHVSSDWKISKSIGKRKDGPLGWFLLRKTEANSFLQPSRRRKRYLCTSQLVNHQTPELDCDNNCFYEELDEYDRCIESFDIRDFVHSFVCRRDCGEGTVKRCWSMNTADFSKLSKVETSCTLSGGITKVNGGIGSWGAWRPCTVTCGGGTQARYRRCSKPLPLHGGTICTEERRNERNCSYSSCPVDGNWGSWNHWLPCSKTCGGGVKSRSRSCDNPAPSHGGVDCAGDMNTTSTCNNQNCPVDGKWGSWNNWLPCSTTCGGGEKSRSRSCDNPAPSHGGVDCAGDMNETSTCNNHHCPVDGKWGSWNNWLPCSTTCGGGVKSRSRSCDNPAPSHGGVDCVGDRDEKSTCNNQNCPVDGGWGSWDGWLTCSKTCGGGMKSRSRSCDNPAPSHGGVDCVGDRDEKSTCNNQNCPVDGGWGSWDGWLTCSKTCGGGVKSRSRSCDNQAPSHGGVDCDGDRDEKSTCINQNCPVDGKWGSWNNWLPCSTTCGGGEKSRSRSCDNPAPSHGGVDCAGDINETSTCNNHHCPVDGGWGSWDGWLTCSKTCGGGVKSRSRSCDNPAPSHGGVDCVGDRDENSTCINQNCPVDGGWGSWDGWLTCSKTCGGGVKSRSRSCDNPAPSHGGVDCAGDRDEKSTCKNENCPVVDGGWGSWHSWLSCSKTCGGGKKLRSRSCDNPAPSHGGVDCAGDMNETSKCSNHHCPGRGRSGCRCKCSKLGVKTNVSAAQLAEMMENTKKELTVDKTQTSIAVRKKISSSDPRTSSHYIGGLGVVMLVFSLLFLVFFDLLNVFQFCSCRHMTSGPAPSLEVLGSAEESQL